MPDLQLEEITKEFPTPQDPLIILKGISLNIQASETAAILGPSGSGKSTLLHIMGTLDWPTSGSVRISGTDPTQLSEKDLADFRNRNIGFIFQDHHLLPQLSVLENVLVPTIAQGHATDEDVDRAESLIQRVGLTDRAGHRPAELSGGERQRVAVARALIRNPQLVLADEPTGSLDRQNAMAIGKLLLDLQSQEETILIVVTHSEELGKLFHRVLHIDDGRLR